LFDPTEITVIGNMVLPVDDGVATIAGSALEMGADCPPPHAAKVAENAATAANRNTVRSEVIPKTNLGMTSRGVNLAV
jgi:hypothetical protein